MSWGGESDILTPREEVSIYQLQAPYQLAGDQQQAVEKLCKSIVAGNKHQALQGVTGSGKTYSLANVIQAVGRRTLVISHNKTLAAQLYSELKAFFPHNAVEYFVSTFDYYQPEAYMPSTDTYIEKDSAINDEIERLCLNAMSSLLTRQDVIVVASVSCIYGLAAPSDYQDLMLHVHVGDEMDRDDFLRLLVERCFERDDFALARGKFRARGDVVDVFPAQLDKHAVRVEFFGEEVERLSLIDALTGNVIDSLQEYVLFPTKIYVSAAEKRGTAIVAIRAELEQRIATLEEEGKLIEAQRLRIRTESDLELIEEIGFCKGVENYSRHLGGRAEGSAPATLIDFFLQGDFLTIIDESHATIPQIGGMNVGDRNRKSVLVEHGFRLPSALDNRPLRFDEFMAKQQTLVYASATLGPFELINCRSDNQEFIPVKRASRPGEKPPLDFLGVWFQSARDIRVVAHSSVAPVGDFHPANLGETLIVEQIIRPTGLVEPKITLLPLQGQIDATIALCHERIAKNERVLITALTKRTAEELSEYLAKLGLRVAYIHADVDTIERVEILRSLRRQEIDVLVGINLLREGLDLPEVSLVCILDADKEGFLRNETSLVQTAGRAARHVNGECVLFCDTVTDSIKRLLEVTDYRRRAQEQFNQQHGIRPQSVVRPVQETLRLYEADTPASYVVAEDVLEYGNIKKLNKKQRDAVIAKLRKEMEDAAAHLEFERAILLRNQIADMS